MTVTDDIYKTPTADDATAGPDEQPKTETQQNESSKEAGPGWLPGFMAQDYWRRRKAETRARKKHEMEQHYRWRNSPEFARFARIRNVLVPAFILLALLFPVGIHVDNPEYFNVYGFSGVALFVSILFFAACIMVTILVVSLEGTQKREFEERLSLGLAADEISDKEDELLHQAADGKMDPTSLWVINQRRIRLYHETAQKQARSSYTVALAAGIVGFLIILAIGAMAAFATSGTASIAAAAVGVAGAAMGAYIGATFMKIQAEASSQFRQFFREPVEVSRLLGAERLINMLGDEGEKAKAVQIVVSAMMTDTSTPTDSGRQ